MNTVIPTSIPRLRASSPSIMYAHGQKVHVNLAYVYVFMLPVNIAQRAP
ncbi:MAG: hypothetical protein QXZ48_08025 [Zestosphaera sp.]